MHDRKSNRVENPSYFLVVKRLHSTVSQGIKSEHIKEPMVSYSFKLERTPKHADSYSSCSSHSPLWLSSWPSSLSLQALVSKLLQVSHLFASH